MKIESVSIQNFKLFKNLEVSFKHKTLEEISNRFLVLGDNGTGKTTLLQAIALPLALATKRIPDVAGFDWPGFLSARFLKWGRPRIQLEVSFDKEEIEATKDIAARWYQAQSKEFQSEHEFVEPSNSTSTKILLAGDYWKVGQHNTTSERSQFLGRYYAQGLLWAEDTSVRSEFSKLPGVFWFDQFRNLGSSSYSENHGDRKEDKGSDFGVGGLRKVLIQWNRRQASGLTDDYLTTLENFYQKIFPERSFNGIETMPSLNSVMEDEDFFVLNDGHHTYDIVEMSAGEQSILPILYEFVRKKIAYSIVLIDEIDLNLHPPAAQSLLRQLFKISPTCQFILTTHSEAITNVLSNNETYRLPGSSLCL